MEYQGCQSLGNVNYYSGDVIRSLREVPVWHLQECWGLPAYSLLPVFLPESLSFHADAVAGTCQYNLENWKEIGKFASE